MITMYKIIDIIHNGTHGEFGKRRTSAEAKPCQLYDEWIGMTVESERDIEVGHPMFLEYVADKNGDKVVGCMHTSNVEGVEYKDNLILMSTMNSVYILEELGTVIVPMVSPTVMKDLERG